jgi:hypothetical protein
MKEFIKGDKVRITGGADRGNDTMESLIGKEGKITELGSDEDGQYAKVLGWYWGVDYLELVKPKYPEYEFKLLLPN